MKNPQGMEHAKPFLEFSGKDTHENLKRAAFEPSSKVRRDMEAICDRRCVSLILETVTAHQVIVAINTDPDHDRMAPKPLPTSSIECTSAKADAKCTEHGIIELDFNQVKSIRLVHDSAKEHFEGLSFFGGQGGDECIATAQFRQPIHHKGSAVTAKTKVLQHIIAGMLTADLLFLSTFFGHMGATCTHPCIFCLAKLDSMKSIFAPNRTAAPERTIDDIIKCSELYNSMYGEAKEHEQLPALRRQTTQVFTKSIAKPILGNIDIDCVSRAKMHVILGFTRQLVEMMFKFTEKVESMHTGIATTRPAIVKIYEQAKSYETWLESQLEGTKIALSAQEEQTNVFMTRISRLNELLSFPNLSDADRETFTEKLRVLEKDFEQWDEQLHVTDDEEEEHKFQVLEQLGVVSQTRKELEVILSKHEGFSHRLVTSTLKKHGVDMKRYHEGMIIGNHCFEFAKNGENIMKDLTTEMKQHVDDDNLRASLDKFQVLMTAVISKWYDVMKCIKSVRKQSDEEVEKYKTDIEDLKQAMIQLIEKEPPLAGDDNPLKFPSSIKTHILFDGDSIKQLEEWRTFGGVDEENIESVHAIFNQLKRRFCGTRGKKQKKLVFEQFLFNGSNFIREGIKEIKEGTKAKNPAKTIKRKPATEDTEDNNTSAASNSSSALDEFDVPSGKFDWDKLVEDVDEELPSDLSEEEAAVNSNPALHMFKFEGNAIDTRITICPDCNKRMLRLAFSTHKYEIHSAAVVEEAESAE